MRPAAEEAWSVARVGLDADWLAAVEHADRRPRIGPHVYPQCGCLDDGRPAPVLHPEPQDMAGDPWKRLCRLIDRAAADGRDTLDLYWDLPRDDPPHIVTLPPTVGNLTAVRRLRLAGSHLVRMPPEVAGMVSLVEYTTYTSYRLHWYPFEITRCPYLRESTVSTRALYGNYKRRSQFPVLGPYPQAVPMVDRPCSVCQKLYPDRGEHRVWVSLRVATDVLPLIVNACSAACVASLPAGAEGHVAGPHRGGSGVVQPERRW